MIKLIQQNKTVLLLGLLFVIPLLDLFHTGLPLTHDGQDHIARVANFYQNLSDGNLVPRWAPHLNWGYGHPILMFLYPLPSYLASLFHFLHFSLIDSVKLVFGIAFVASGCAMYVWVRNIFSSNAAIVAASLYTLAPYRFIDMYVRGAFGEHVAFVFPPLVLYFLYKLSRKYTYWHGIGITLSTAGLILSHNAVSLMFLPIIAGYIVFLFYESRFSRIFLLHSIFSMLLGFGLAAFFWLPAFIEGKYTLREIVTKGEYVHHFVPWQRFIYSPWNYGISGQFSVQIGLLHWGAVLVGALSIPLLFKKKDKWWVVSLASIVLFGLALFLMTADSNIIWQHVSLLQKFQFPWRLLSIEVFITALLGGIGIYMLPKKIQLPVTVIAVVFIFLANSGYWHANTYVYKPDTFFTTVYQGTTDTGESAPIWSVRFMERTPAAVIEVIDGEAEIHILERTATKHIYTISVQERALIKENTLYFPGWIVLIDGKPVTIEFQDRRYHGIITFPIEKGQHRVEILFQETKLRAIANMISVGSLFTLAVLFFKKYKQ